MDGAGKDGDPGGKTSSRPVTRWAIEALVRDARDVIRLHNELSRPRGYVLILIVGPTPDQEWPMFAVKVVGSTSIEKTMEYTHTELLPALSMALAVADTLERKKQEG